MKATISFLLISMAIAAAAQQSAPTTASQPTVPTIRETVEVTATRTPEDPEKVPTAIQVFTGDELAERGATDLRSALALATGVSIAPGGDAGPASAVPA